MAKANAKSTARKSKSSGAGKGAKARRNGAGAKHVESEKLVEYVARAAGKERHIEAALAAHLVMTTRPAYHGRLEEHLRATKVRAEKLEGRMKELGGSTRSISGASSAVMGEVKDAAKMVADRAVSLAKGPLDAMRDDHEAEALLENARVEYSDACEQIGTYTVVHALAKAADDKSTQKLAKDFRGEHTEMAEFVEKLIPKLSSAVVKTEVRGRERSGSGAQARSTSSSRSSSGSRSKAGSKASGGSRSRSRGGGASRAKPAASRSTRAASAGPTPAATAAASISGSSASASGGSKAGGSRARSSGAAPKRPATPKRS